MKHVYALIQTATYDEVGEITCIYPTRELAEKFRRINVSEDKKGEYIYRIEQTLFAYKKDCK